MGYRDLFSAELAVPRDPKFRDPEIPGDRVLFHRLKKRNGDQRLKKNLNKQSKILTLTTTASLILLATLLPSAHAYGNTAQWQVGFSGNCHDVTSCQGTSGFWGWCQFGGSTGSTAAGTTGTSGDCQVTVYARSSLGEPNNPTHQSIDITGWKIMPSFMSPTGLSFQITASTLECTGPGASLPPTPFTGCALPPGGDTGIPSVAGHYSFSPFPGFKINIQVNQLP